MKNLKKVLSLVLALAMALSLMTVAFAKDASDYDDYAEVNYNEAVDVMTAVGVFDGMGGSFNPDGTLTREQAAKIITYMIMGKDAADKLTTTIAPYSDVSASRWSAGAIAYCTNEGILSGVGHGKFDPTGELTGLQFAKMLLVALGYDPAIETFTGDSWAINVATLAIDTGLDDGMKTVSLSAPLTREQAAQMAFNTMLTPMVRYADKGTNITLPGGGSVIVDASDATPVTRANATAISDEEYGSLPMVEFAEQYCPNLRVDGDQYAQGRVGRTLAYKGNTISSFAFADDLLATSADGTTLADLTTRSSEDYIGYKPADAGVTYLVNDGVSSQSAVAAIAAKNGGVVNFLDTNSDGKYDVVSAVEKRVAQLGGDARTSTTGSVTKVTIPGVVTSKDADDVVYPSGLVKDDVVLYYNSNNGTTYVEKAESVTGTTTANTTDKITVDSTSYGVSGLTGASTHTDLVNYTKAKTGTTFYLDNGGNICFYVLDDTAVTLENTLFVRDADHSAYVYYAKVVFMDGTTGTITVDKTAAYNGSLKEVFDEGTSTMADGYLKENTFYTYTKNDNNSYSLTACQYQGVTAAATDNGTAAVVTKGTATITLATPSATIYANGNTAYVLEKGSVSGTFTPGDSYSAYTGVSNTAGYKDAVASDSKQPVAYALYDSSNNAVAVVARNGVLDTTSAADYDVVLPVAGPSTVYKTDGSVDYYAYEAVVNGEYVASYKVANTTLLTLGTPVLVNSYDGDKANGVEGASVNMSPNTVGTGTEVNVTNGTLTVENAAGTIQGAAALASDAKMVIYDVADKTAEVVDPMNLYAEDGHYYTVTTVATSNTNSAEKYVFVNDYATAAPTISATSVEAKLAAASGSPAAVNGTFQVTVAAGYTATATSGNTGIATVTGTITPGSASTITVTGVAAGTTTVDIAVTHTASGIVTHYTVNVSVVAQ